MENENASSEVKQIVVLAEDIPEQGIVSKSSESELDSDTHFDHNLTFESRLEDMPDVLKYLKQLQKYIKKQERKIKKLKSKLKRYKSRKKSVECIESCTQTYVEEPKTFTEEIKEAAENAVAQTGFVYESTSGLYYDYKTGYYYNAELGLYYDGNRGMYLVYNQETQSYDFHSQIELPEIASQESDKKRKKRHKDKGSKRKKNEKLSNDTSNGEGSVEEGECMSSDEISNCSSTNSTGTSEENLSELSKSWPPCMRIILKESDLKNVRVGSLFIITCDGGTLGREGEHAILIPDINISKVHAKITFDREADKYVLVDLGSRNGTILNGKRISPSKKESDPIEIVHGSTLQLGSTKLLCHIHTGQQTCGHCEPGLIQTPVMETVTDVDIPKPSKGSQHKKELRRLKKRFGIESNTNPKSELACGYTDRAHVRRKEVGSHNSNEKTQVTSVNESISSDNKGFKMLAKMGWNKGDALGKEGSGLTEPVLVTGNQGKTGLGAESMEVAAAVPVDPAVERKAKMWKKAQERFQKVRDTPNTAEDIFEEDH